MGSRAGTLLALALILGFLHFARAPLVVLLFSIFLSFIATPFVNALQKLRLPRALAALIAMFFFLGTAYVGVYFSYNGFVSFAHDLPSYLSEMRSLVIHVREKVPLDQIAETTAPKGMAKPVKVEQVSDWTGIFGSVSQVTEVVFYAVFVPFITYFMLTWHNHLRSATVGLFAHSSRQAADATLGKISSMLRKFLIGNVLVALFIGTVSLIVFGIIGMPHFYFIAYISGFLSLIPYLGVILASVPPIAADLQNLHSAQLLAILITVISLHVFSMNVLYPKFLGHSLELNPLAASVGILFWGWLWGGLGLLLAIPITGALKIICDHIPYLKPYAAWLGDDAQDNAGGD